MAAKHTLVCFEHTRLPLIDAHRNGEVGITLQDADQLAALERTLPKGAIAWGHQCVKFAHHCGVIVLPNTVIEVLPKIDKLNGHGQNKCRATNERIAFALNTSAPSAQVAVTTVDVSASVYNVKAVLLKQLADFRAALKA